MSDRIEDVHENGIAITIDSITYFFGDRLRLIELLDERADEVLERK